MQQHVPSTSARCSCPAAFNGKSHRHHVASTPCAPWRMPPDPVLLSARVLPALHMAFLSTRCGRALVATASSASSEQPVEVEIPGSQQQAVDEAAAALRPLLQPLLRESKAAKKGFGKARASGNRFAVEIPAADTSPSSQSGVAASLLAALGPAVPGRATVVFADARAAVLPLAGSRAVLGLSSACREAALSGPLLLVGPKVEDVLLVKQLLSEVWQGPYVVLLNPEWATGVPDRYADTPASFEVAFSFLPCAIQGLMGTKEGAVLRRVHNGDLAGSPWRILLQSRQRFLQVGQTKVRPSPSDLELAFMNAAAASSPLTGAAKFFRGVKEGLTGLAGGAKKG